MTSRMFPERQYRKRPIEVTVRIAAVDGVLLTWEGSVAYKAGDALLTGAKGEEWPVEAARFGTTYRPVAPTQSGQSGLYEKLPMIVRAHQAQSAQRLQLSNERGSLRARAGDWIIQAPDGDRWVVADEVFHETYEAADDL